MKRNLIKVVKMKPYFAALIEAAHEKRENVSR
ncbi:hypothetical protein ACPB0Q_12875 [Escherichia coli]